MSAKKLITNGHLEIKRVMEERASAMEVIKKLYFRDEEWLKVMHKVAAKFLEFKKHICAEIDPENEIMIAQKVKIVARNLLDDDIAESNDRQGLAIDWKDRLG